MQMKSQRDIFSVQEKRMFALRALYEDAGYARFPMRRFEEYALYLENKSFLKSESVLAFANANGKLMALKPDVTLSIVKHAGSSAGGVEKLYYNESVYRVSQTDQEFSEIEQMGVELLGQVDLPGMCEVLRLAVESLQTISESYVLEVSHMGFAAGLMEAARLKDEEKVELFGLIQQKNGHELRGALARMPIAPSFAECIAELTGLSGSYEKTLAKAEAMVANEEMAQAVEELKQIFSTLEELELCAHVRLDFSILNNLDYYNGVVFQGYVRGASRMVLSGGRYDYLMRKFGKEGGGIGFALYLDELSQLIEEPREDDLDVLLLYGRNCSAAELIRAAAELRKKGAKVMLAPEGTTPARAAKTLRYVQGQLLEVE